MSVRFILYAMILALLVVANAGVRLYLAIVPTDSAPATADELALLRAQSKYFETVSDMGTTNEVADAPNVPLDVRSPEAR